MYGIQVILELNVYYIIIISNISYRLMKENGVVLHNISDNTARSTSGVMFGALTLSAMHIGHGFEPLPDQSKKSVLPRFR